ACHASEKGEVDVHRTEIGGDSVDLGGFRQYVHRRQTTRAVEWSAEIEVAGLEGRVAELLAPIQTIRLSVTIGLWFASRAMTSQGAADEPPMAMTVTPDHGERIPSAEPRVVSYEIEGDGESLLRMSARPANRLQLDRLSHEHPVLRKVLAAIIETATTA